jgi:hypothetical protein
MDAPKLQVKLFSDNVDGSNLKQFIPVFHRWIRDHLLDELMIDVADYSHVHHGPGVVLVGHASDYYLDLSDGQPGLLYSRKRQAPEPGERLRDAFRRAINACLLLEADPALNPRPKFRSNEALIKLPDRLDFSNEDPGFDSLKREFETFLGQLYAGGRVKLTRVGSNKSPLSVRVVAEGAPDLQTLLGRVGGPINPAPATSAAP